MKWNFDRPARPETGEAPAVERRGYDRRFAQLIEAAPGAMLILNLEGRIVAANRQVRHLFGVRHSELARMDAATLLAPRHRDRYREWLHAFRNSPECRQMRRRLQERVELEGVRRDGTRFPVEIAVTALPAAGGPLLVIAGSDISARKRYERVLRARSETVARRSERSGAASLLKSRLLARISHDMRTPLGVIVGGAEMLHRGFAGTLSDEQREFASDILSCARHLLRLVDDILDLSGIEAGELALRPEPVDLERVVGEVGEILRVLLRRKRIELRCDIAPDLRSLVLDAARLRQILYNYLSNAIKFSPDGGCVHVRGRPEPGRRFRLEVEDHGIGIEPDGIASLFKDFSQLDAGAGRQHAGTGLGLALTRRIVEAQGGFVGVRSVPGSGSTFYAVMPMEPAMGVGHERNPHAAIPDTRRGRSRSEPAPHAGRA